MFLIRYVHNTNKDLIETKETEPIDAIWCGPEGPKNGLESVCGIAAALENGTQIQKHLFFAAKPLAITAHAVGGTILSLYL
jgi:hypothetical protein